MKPEVYKMSTSKVAIDLTKEAGHLTASFSHFPHIIHTKKVIEPFSKAPWRDETLAGELPPVLRVLSGDFDCWFGGNGNPYTCEGKQLNFPPHGDPANNQ